MLLKSKLHLKSIDLIASQIKVMVFRSQWNRNAKVKLGYIGNNCNSSHPHLLNCISYLLKISKADFYCVYLSLFSFESYKVGIFMTPMFHCIQFSWISICLKHVYFCMKKQEQRYTVIIFTLIMSKYYHMQSQLEFTVNLIINRNINTVYIRFYYVNSSILYLQSGDYMPLTYLPLLVEFLFR